MSPRCHIVDPVDRYDGGSMNAEDLVPNFKKDMANLSKTERRRAIESVRDVIWIGYTDMDSSGRDAGDGRARRATRPVSGASPPCRIQIRQGGDHCAIARR